MAAREAAHCSPLGQIGPDHASVTENAINIT